MESGADQHRIITKRQLVRWLVPIFAIVVVAGAIMLKIVQIYLAGLTELAATAPTLAAARMSGLLELVFVSTAVFAVGVGSYVVWYGYRAVRSKCFPPPGAWVIEGKPVYTGVKAQWLAWVRIALGIIMPVAAGYAVYRAWVLLPTW